MLTLSPSNTRWRTSIKYSCTWETKFFPSSSMSGEKCFCQAFHSLANYFNHCEHTTDIYACKGVHSELLVFIIQHTKLQKRVCKVLTGWYTHTQTQTHTHKHTYTLSNANFLSFNLPLFLVSRSGLLQGITKKISVHLKLIFNSSSVWNCI